MTATNQRRIRFVMQREIYNTPILRALFKLMGVIPVSSGDSKKELLEFIRRARAELDAGYMVCIFAEGELTRTGMLREFRGGFRADRQGKRLSDYPGSTSAAPGAASSATPHGRLLSRPPALAPYRVRRIVRDSPAGHQFRRGSAPGGDATFL